MSIYLKSVYDDITMQLGQGVGNTKLNSAFVRAVNRTLSELENRADTGTDFELVDSMGDTISDLADKHEYILYAGIMYWLQRMGYASGDPRVAAAVLSDSERMWRQAIGDYIKDKVNDAQATGTSDIIGLGYLG